MASPAPGRINLNACARPIPVDQRTALRYYYRIADNLLRQASIYREEKDKINLYIILLRYSSLLCDTIPKHRDYTTYDSNEKILHKKRLHSVLNELESLKPIVLSEIDEINSRNSGQANGSVGTNNMPLARNQFSATPLAEQGKTATFCERSQLASSVIVRPDGQKHTFSLSLPAKEETLSRHSLLGPNGLAVRWPEPVSATTITKVGYPNNVDAIQWENSSLSSSGKINYDFESILSLNNDRLFPPVADSSQLSTNALCDELPGLNVREPTPPPVLAQVHTAYREIPPENVADPRPGIPSDGIHYQNVHVPANLMDSFLRVAEANTRKNLETCAVLTGTLKNSTFYITTLIIPKQTATSDSCQTENEEELFAVQSERDLFTVGWIHTHPTQTCFLSSVDLHTHYSYQVMLPEAIAIVMAPKDPERNHGIFHLSDPGGMSIINQCQGTGFHPHEEPLDGSSIYEHCSHVYINSKVKFDVLDLRNS